MKRLLVTGGTGFIGSHLAASAIQQGQDVHALGLVESSSDRENAEWLQQMGVNVFPGSISDRALCARALSGVSCVYHLAVAMREAGVSNDHYLNVNLEGTRRLLIASTQAGVARFIYCGTVGIFGHNFE